MSRPSELPDFPASQLFLRRLAYHLVHDEARAEDLVQDTWAAWVEHKPRGVAEPRAWLARVLRNRALNLKRGDERRTRREQLAGRPDPSAPETDGTLEAQAQLIAVLRELEEPYRSTLVQRYYHDLAPKEIAERAGTPLNTVKARLARGLEKLRAAMDARYRGDRRAWCHWLTILGAPSAPIAAPPSHAPLTGVGGTPLTVGWIAALFAVVAAVVWHSHASPSREPSPRSEKSSRTTASTLELPPVERAEKPARDDATPAEDLPPASLDSATLAQPAVLPATGYASAGGAAGRAAFDWPQYGGGPEHDNARTRTREIRSPKVLWFVPGCAGQPTLEGNDLYTGGLGLARLDPDTGTPTGLFLDLFGHEVVLAGSLEEMVDQATRAIGELDESKLQAFAAELRRLDQSHDLLVAPAPVITSKLVLARRARDGSVIAFDRGMKEVWRWESGWDASVQDSPRTRVPLCLTDAGIVLVPFDDQLVALRASDGRELWRYFANGTIAMVPAASGDRVFLGNDRGQFVALSASTGRMLWQRRARAFDASSPMVVGERVFAIDQSDGPWQTQSDRARLYAWDVRNGASFWDSPVFRTGQSSTGLSFSQDSGAVVVPAPFGSAHFDAVTGKQDFRASSTRAHVLSASGTVVVVGNTFVVADEEGRLNVVGREGEGELRWAFQAPEHAQVQDFVHTGDRIYVATTIGLFCLADDPTRAPPAPGFVLEWEGDPNEPTFVTGEEK